MILWSYSLVSLSTSPFSHNSSRFKKKSVKIKLKLLYENSNERKKECTEYRMNVMKSASLAEETQIL